MPMLYIINDTRISEHLSDSIDVNSTTDIYLLNVLSVSLEENFPDIYEKINQEVIVRRFNELSQEEFMICIKEIEKISMQDNLPEWVNEGLILWYELLDPLLKNDIRYISKLDRNA